MKLHTVFITHNRLELTKQALSSYLSTVTAPHTIWFVDNASTDGTIEWINDIFVEGTIHGMILFRENHYPGYACNAGWEHVTDDVTHLHRADNDFEFLPGWCTVVQRAFRNRRLGQLGLRTNEEELFNWNNVGGNCVLRRDLWDMGLRYDERPWPQIAEEVGPGWSEDGLLSPAVLQMGARWGRVKTPCIRPLANPVASDPYYVRSLGDRGVELT